MTSVNLPTRLLPRESQSAPSPSAACITPGKCLGDACLSSLDCESSYICANSVCSLSGAATSGPPASPAAPAGGLRKTIIWGLNLGSVIAIGVGILVFLILVIGLIIWFVRKKRRQKNAAAIDHNRRSTVSSFGGFLEQNDRKKLIDPGASQSTFGAPQPFADRQTHELRNMNGSSGHVNYSDRIAPQRPPQFQFDDYSASQTSLHGDPYGHGHGYDRGYDQGRDRGYNRVYGHEPDFGQDQEPNSSGQWKFTASGERVFVPVRPKRPSYRPSNNNDLNASAPNLTTSSTFLSPNRYARSENAPLRQSRWSFRGRSMLGSTIFLANDNPNEPLSMFRWQRPSNEPPKKPAPMSQHRPPS